MPEEEKKGAIAHEVYHACVGRGDGVIPGATGIAVLAVIVVIGLCAQQTIIYAFPSLHSYLFIIASELGIVVSGVVCGIGSFFWVSRSLDLRADKFAASIVGGRVYKRTICDVSRNQKPRLQA